MLSEYGYRDDEIRDLLHGRNRERCTERNNLVSDETTPAEEEPVLYEREGAVGVLTLNRPKALNSLTVGMLETMGDILDGIEADADTRVLVVTGTGEKAFCVGADLKSRGEKFDAGLIHDPLGLAGAQRLRATRESPRTGDHGHPRLRPRAVASNWRWPAT